MFGSTDFSDPTSPACITCGELVRSARLLGSRYEFEGYVPDEQEAVLDGAFNTAELQPGLILHAARTRDRYNLQSRNAQLTPGVKIVVVVDGLTDFSFGDRRFELGALAGERAGRTHGALVNLTQADTFSRRWQRGRHERKVSLTLGREWLARHGLPEVDGVGDFLDHHLAGETWLLSARAIELARLILHVGHPGDPVSRLRLQAHCVELVAEAFGTTFAQSTASDGLRQIDRRRLRRLDEILNDPALAGLSMHDIARTVGSNPTTLQLLARRAWGCTVSERARGIRMAHARHLLKQGASIAEAATVAGYGSAANFSTAFRQHYGQTPRQVRTGPSCGP